MAALIAYYSRAGEKLLWRCVPPHCRRQYRKSSQHAGQTTGGELYKIEQGSPIPRGYKTCIAEAKADLQKPEV